MDQYNFQGSAESVENQNLEDFSGLNNVPIPDFGDDFGVGNTVPNIDLDDIDEELETTNTTQSTTKRRAAKQKARCWDHFKLVTTGTTADRQPIFKAVCKYYEDERNNFDILRWWRQNERQYPIVSVIARDLLTPLVSTVASESAFSTGGRMLTDMRSRLKPDILESLMCLKDWEDAELRIQDKVSLILAEEMDELST
ncbi:Zinc finger BED domain-containing protein DAYSLEEPER [Abeliophyllum distichum]|uniref:Zinc finger BED domain-containing protein DAYSLEEPER n=1 Tax=Abeliophyllum distichum TaxID=126358 RepID=A0ABD1QWY5_9LAMI